MYDSNLYIVCSESEQCRDGSHTYVSFQTVSPATSEQGKETGVGVHTVGKLEEIVDTLITTNNFYSV